MAGWALCMILVLAALAGAARETRYEKFLRQHVDYPQTSVNPPHLYCDIMVQRRNITAKGPSCKPVNTFVNAPAQEMDDTCNQTADAAGRYTTPNRLNITICRLRPGSPWPTCQYNNRQALHFVVVNCINGLPVHLDSTYPC